MTASAGTFQGWALWSQAGWLATMFGLAWAIAAWQFRPQRGAYLSLAWGNVLGGVSMLLMGLRGDWPWFATHTLVNLLQLLCYSQLWLTAMAFAGQPMSRREPFAVALLGVVLVLGLGLSPQTEVERIAVALLLNLWVTVRGGWQVARRLNGTGCTGGAWVMSAVCMAVGLVLVLRVAAALAGNAPLGGEPRLRATVGMSLVFFGSTFCFNVTMAYMALGRLMRQVHQLQHDDGLTGLPDRGSLQRMLDFEWRRFERRRVPFALLSIAVDQLPSIRTRLGTETAAAVLAEVALSLRLRLRSADLLGHAGDGVFVVLLPDTGLPAAQVLAAGLAQALAGFGDLHPEEGESLRLSIGMATPATGEGAAGDVLARAEASRAAVRATVDGRPRAAPPLVGSHRRA